MTANTAARRKLFLQLGSTIKEAGVFALPENIKLTVSH